MMKARIFLGLATTVLIAGSLIAADEKKALPVKGVLPQQWGKLGLSDEQKQKIYAVQAEFHGKIADMKKKTEELEGEKKIAMEKILTEDQKKELTKILLHKAPGLGKEKEKTPESK